MSFLGSALGPISSIVGGLFQNSAAKNSASTQRDWEERMSNTAHRREVKDLRSAGLNPILSATGGNGASTPTGATAQTTNVASTAGSDFVSAKRLDEVDKKSLVNQTDIASAQVKNLGSQDQLNTVNAAKALEETKTATTTQAVNSALAAKTNADTVTSLAQAKLVAAQTAETDSRVPINRRMLSKMDAEIENLLANASLSGTTSALNVANVNRVGADIGRINADTGRITAQTKNEGQHFDLNKNRQNYENKSGVAPYLPYAKGLLDTFSDFIPRGYYNVGDR